MDLRMVVWLPLLGLPLIGIGCSGNDSNDTAHQIRYVSALVLNDTNQTLTLVYSITDHDFLLGDSLKSTTDHLEPHTQRWFSVSYETENIPELHITGPGFDRFYNPLVYQDDRIVIAQGDLTLNAQ